MRVDVSDNGPDQRVIDVCQARGEQRYLGFDVVQFQREVHDKIVVRVDFVDSARESGTDQGEG